MRVIGRNLARGQVEDDGLRKHRLAVLVAAVDLDFVGTLRFEPRGLQAKHDHAVKGRRELVADESVETRAEDVNEPVGRRLGAVREQGPFEAHPSAIIDGRSTLPPSDCFPKDSSIDGLGLSLIGKALSGPGRQPDSTHSIVVKKLIRDRMIRYE